ncbi:MAG: tetratricopeptide repeat protein [Cytophagales bacterium]|nr:tetratricopeptide repeat protein [Cytophagales bacterium]
MSRRGINICTVLGLCIITFCSTTLHAQSPSENFEKGSAAFEVANYKLCIKYLDDALKIKPEWDKALFIRGKAYLELGNYNGGLDNFNAAVIINPHDAEYYYYRARCEWRLKRTKGAIQDLESALSYNSQHFEAYQTLGDIYLELRLFRQAKEYFDKAMAINPNFVPKTFHHHQTNSNKEDYQIAMQEFNKEIENDSKNGEAYFNRGLLREMIFDNDGAISDFTKAIQYDTTIKIAYFYRSKIKQSTQDYKGAYDDLLIFLKRFPGDAEGVKHQLELKKQLKYKY